MRTTVNMDEEVHEYAAYYARARGLTLGEAVNELIRKARNAKEPEPEILMSPNGFPMFPPSGNGQVLTSEMVKKLEEEEFDPEAFA